MPKLMKRCTRQNMLSKNVLSLGLAVFLMLCSCSSSKKSQIKNLTAPNWMDPWIEQEFRPFEKSGITKEMLDTTWEKCISNENFHRYKIIDSKIYGPNTRIRNLLEVLVNKYPMPDLDFIYYYQDIPNISQLGKKWAKSGAPILGPAKQKNADRIILFVDWYYDIKNQDGGWNQISRLIDENIHQWPWDKKIQKLFWRGAPVDGFYKWESWTNLPRGRLVYESKYRYPDLIDAAFSRYTDTWFIEDPLVFKENLGEAPFISPVDQLQFKYHIDIDGVTCTCPAFPWKLLSGCLVFKQTSNDIMWFHREMTPWKHFIPVHNDLRDVVEKITWAKEHDLQAKQIAENGREFAKTHLREEDILLYCYKTLLKYASLQKF
jgi:hypothetical protein